MNINLSVTNLVRRPIDGHVLSASGRLIPQPPWVLPESPLSIAAYDQWLIDQAREEAMDLCEDWLLTRLVGVTADSVDADLRYLLSDFLFGHPNPVFEARQIVDDATVD